MLRRLAITATCALALALTATTAAHADSRTLVDGPGDVWKHNGDPEQVPDHRRGDILRVKIRHNADQVVIRTKFAQLDRQGPRFVVATRLRTNTGLIRWARLQAGPGRSTWAGDTHVFRRDNTTRVECAASHRLDYADDVAVVRVPRSCLGRPRWVQAAMGVASITARGFFADNPLTHGPTETLPHYTSRIRRG